MNKKLIITSICLSISVTSCAIAKSIVEKKQIIVEKQIASKTATNLTGVYGFKEGENSNEFRILQISKKQIKAEFIGNYEYEAEAGTTVNSGVINAQIVGLENLKATLTVEDMPECRVTLDFQDQSLEARQSGDCGFPYGIDASGIYRRTSIEKPNFDFDTENSEMNMDENTHSYETEVNSPTARPIPIKFKKGESSTIVGGTIKEGEAVSYIVQAKRGQTLEIEVIKGSTINDVVVSVKNKNGQILGGDENYGEIWKGELPVNGEYIISVNTIETKDTNFKISVYIL